jgi:YidC/Oxa1 family membrane protein insertase
LIAWQYFFATAFRPKEFGRKASQVGLLTPNAALPPQVRAKQAESFPPAQQLQRISRQEALSRWPRIAIETDRLRGSISLMGGWIDDLLLVQYHETTDPKSPANRASFALRHFAAVLC